MAVLLLLLLGQKSGGTLLLHCLFHAAEKAETKSSPSQNNSLHYACNCIDDFSSPFEDTGSIALPASTVHSEKPVSFCEQFYVTPPFHFHSLRAPPASVA